MLTERFLKLVNDLQEELKGYTRIELTWSWICLKLLKLLSNYPSGVTTTIMLSELHNEAEITGGKLSCSLHEQTKSSVDSIVDTRSVSYESVLEVTVSSSYTVPNTTTKVVVLSNSVERGSIEMYLHKKYYHMIDILSTHALRMTCCRLVPRDSKSKPHLLPAEHLVVLLQPEQELELRKNKQFLSLSEAASLIIQPKYISSVYAKISNIEKEEVLTVSDGTVFRRRVVNLVCENSSVPLVLWDSYSGFARLFKQGDTLLIERPYAKPSSMSVYCMEYAPGTIIYVAPYKPTEEVLVTQFPSQQAAVSVMKTDEGMLDFSSYPGRLTVAELRPDIVNATMLLEIESLSYESPESITISARDHTGIVNVLVQGASGGFEDAQVVLLSGLETMTVRDEKKVLYIRCDLAKRGSLFIVDKLPGWHNSQTELMNS